MAAAVSAKEGQGAAAHFSPVAHASEPGPVAGRSSSSGRLLLLHSGSGFEQLGASFELMLRRRGEPIPQLQDARVCLSGGGARDALLGAAGA